MELLILVELLINTVGELIFELVLHAIKESAKSEGSGYPVLSLFGYAFLGAVAGGTSLLVFPHYFVRNVRHHGIGLLLIPLITGITMSLLGKWKIKRGKDVILLDSFSYGFVFAFCFTLVRFIWAK